MRSLLAAILTLFLPPRGAHRALTPPSPPFAQWSAPAPRARLRPADVILADGLPLVRPYLATLGQCHVTAEAAA
ncbi:hypothetical protein [Streptomyces sp. BK239]|uniref:hypothetical protein n=1 Tax=Streptomyces sp. BK239 TaxID=2512155 RepID=UPI0010ED908C|nr:hypothetical protein [Streptomyces sp. BK239]RZU24771.1 hypothetical protein EV567_0232 [Streptomyces sp. BK239]